MAKKIREVLFMNSTFNNRIDAQRQILNIVNTSKWNEELFGLSIGAIDRWQKSNPHVHESIIFILKEIGDVLFFLGTKSQEQITDDYKKMSLDIENLKLKLISTLRDFN